METTDSLLTHPTPLKKNHTHNATPTPTKVRESAASPLPPRTHPLLGKAAARRFPPPPAAPREMLGAPFRSSRRQRRLGTALTPWARRRGGGAAERGPGAERGPTLSAPLPGAARRYLAAGGRFARLRTWARDVIPTTRPAGRPPARGDAAEQTPRPRPGIAGPLLAAPSRAEPSRGRPADIPAERGGGPPAALPGAHPAAPRPRSGLLRRKHRRGVAPNLYS